MPHEHGPVTLGSLRKTGEVIEVNGLAFKIIKADKRRIEFVEVDMA